jgi:hypothetical protein
LFNTFNFLLFNLFFSYNFCHHGSGGATVESPSSQQDPYLLPQKDFKLIACWVQELGSSKVLLPNLDGAVRSSTQQQQ